MEDHIELPDLIDQTANMLRGDGDGPSHPRACERGDVGTHPNA
jgi:hypothetical protein